MTGIPLLMTLKNEHAGAYFLHNYRVYIQHLDLHWDIDVTFLISRLSWDHMPRGR